MSKLDLRTLVMAWIALWCFIGATQAGVPARPVPFTLGREVAFTERGNLTLGVGPASCVGLDGELLVVGTARMSMGQPAVDPKIALADDPYAIHEIGPRWTTRVGATLFQITDQGFERWGFLPTRHAPIAAAFNRQDGSRPSDQPARIYLADAQNVYCFERQGKQFSQRWMYQVEGIQRVIFEPPNRVFVLSSRGFERLADQGHAAEWLHSHLGSVKDLFAKGNTALVFSPQGDAQLLEFEPAGEVRALGPARMLGQARMARWTGEYRCVLVNNKGLEHANVRDIMMAWAGRTWAFIDQNPTTLGRRDRGRLGSVKLDKPEEVEDLLALDSKRVWLRYRDGGIHEVALDAEGKQVGKPRRLEGLKDIVAMAGDDQRQVVVDRSGRVHRVSAEGRAVDTLPKIEAGPWVAVGDQAFIASGSRVHRLNPQAGLGEIVFDLGSGYIRDIKPLGDNLVMLADQQVLTVAPRGTTWQLLAKVELGLEQPGRFMSVGPGLAIVGSDVRTLTSIDLAQPMQPRLLATHTPDFTLTWGGGQGYLRDVLIESDRVLVAAGEIHVFDRASLTTPSATPPAPRLVVPRHLRSFDDMVQTKRIFKIRDGLYHCSSDRNLVIRRAWLMQLQPDGTYQTQYTRLGTTLARDMLMLDDQTALVACGRAGLRAIRWDGLGEGELLGVMSEEACEYEALLKVGQDVFVKNGNNVRIVTPQLQPRSMGTAWTFAPTDREVRLMIDGWAVDSPEYQRQMGYQEPLRVIGKDLSDASGWPALAVPQGQVWIDFKRGRAKFSDGRRVEPKLVGKLPITLWGPIQANAWMQVGKYHLAPAGELSHGVIVMDLSDPDCPRQVAVSSTNPNSGYANKSLGTRGHHAFISWNHPGPGIAVLDVSDPLQPRFVGSRSVPAPTAGHLDRNWQARFEGDRMLVTTLEGLVVFDVADPAQFRKISHHPAMPPLAAWDLSRRLGAWIHRKNQEFQFIDTTDHDQPQVRGRIALNRELGMIKPVNFDWQGNRLWVWGLTAEGKEPRSVLGCFDVTDPRAPRKLGAQSLAGEVSDFMRLDGSLAAVHYRHGDIESWDLSNPGQLQRLGRIEGARTQGEFRFALDARSPGVPYDNRKGAPPNQRYGQSTRFMMAQGRVVWTTGPIVDFTDPSKPRLRGGNMQAFDDEVRGMNLSPDRRRASWIGGVDGFGWMIDLSDPANPRLQWRLERIEAKQHAGLWVRPDWTSDRPAVVETGRALAFAGPDPERYHGGKPMTRFFSGNQITLVSDPIPVPAGKTLKLSAVARTKPAMPRASSRLDIRVQLGTPDRRGRTLARITEASNSDQNVSLEAVFTPDAKMEQLVVEVQAELLGWLSDLQLTGDDGKNLLGNSAWQQPLDVQGMHPGWRLSEVARTLERIASEPQVDHLQHRLYQGMHDTLLIHDLSRPGTFAAGLLAGAVVGKRDAILGLGTLRQGDRNLVVAATEQGMTVNDVTNLREPVTLGRLALPWNTIIRPFVAAVSPNVVVITTGYTSWRQTEGIYIVNIADPRRPRLERYVFENATAGSVHNGWLFKMSYRNGAQIYDLRNPRVPLEICDALFDTSNSGDAPTAVLGDLLLRAHAGGVESWLAPMPDQAPTGKLVIAETQAP